MPLFKLFSPLAVALILHHTIATCLRAWEIYADKCSSFLSVQLSGFILLVLILRQNPKENGKNYSDLWQKDVGLMLIPPSLNSSFPFLS